MITKIELSGPSSNPLTNFTCETGDYQATTTNATWTGEATSVIFNASNAQTRVSSIIVTYTPATAASVATPTLSIPTGKYTEAQNVTIDCATAEASIYYTLDGTEPSEQSTPYNGTINISSTTTLKAIAIKDGESSAVATATYTILTATPATIADFLAAEESEDVYYELTGTISNITNTTYGNFDLTDVTGTVYVYGLTSTFQTSNDKSFASLNLAEGDLITIRGTRASFEGDAQVNGPAYFVSKTELPTLETPTAIAATEITSTGFTANWNAVTNATSYEVNVWTEETIEFGVANSSFENGLDNWTAESGYAISAEQAHTGTQSISFTATDARDLRQTINNVTPGETITVTYWYYLDESTTGNGPRLWCTWEGNSADKTLQAQEYSNTKGAWTEATMSTTVPDGATALNLEIRVYKNSNGYLDDITVTQTNAATTVLTPIAGSPFTATETSKEITDLAAETTYYYNVVAKAEGYTASEASNTISVTTTAEVAEPTITIEGEDLVETEGMYSVALGDTKFSTKTSKTFTLTATGITESIKIKPEIMSGYFTIISSDSEQAEVVEESSMFGTSKVLTFTPDENGEIIDFLGGRDDLERKLIRTVGEADERLEQDALRILRAIRFATVLDFQLDGEVVEAIRKHRSLLKELSYHRKKEELDKIFVSGRAEQGIDMLLDFRLDKCLDLDNLSKVENTNSLIGIWSVLHVEDKYPFSSNEKELMKDIREVMVLNNYDPMALYHYGLYVNSVAGELKGLDKKKITECYNSLSIHRRQDLDLSSEEIMDSLHKTPGEYLSDIYEAIEKEVLYHRLPNEKDKLLAYIQENFASNS